MELCKNEHVYWGTKNISSIETFATANICTLPLLTKNNLSRSTLVASAINEVSPKFVTLQEAYDARITRNLRQLLPNYYAVQSGYRRALNRGGLITLSKEPVLHWQYIPFEKQWDRTLNQFADLLGGKGLLAIETSSTIVINTHFTALYLKSRKLRTFEAFKTQRSQLFQTIKFIQNLHKKFPEKLVVIMGDLNFTPNTDLYEETMKHFIDLTSDISETWSLQRYQHRGKPDQSTDILEDKLDYILVSHAKGLQFIKGMFEKIKVSLFDDESGILSDHRMVLATKH